MTTILVVEIIMGIVLLGAAVLRGIRQARRPRTPPRSNDSDRSTHAAHERTGPCSNRAVAHRHVHQTSPFRVPGDTEDLWWQPGRPQDARDRNFHLLNDPVPSCR
jgi:hypothetical protein